MERKMLSIKLQDRVRNEEIHRRSKVTDALGYIAKMKCKWAGHVSRVQDNRWTIRCTEWSPRGKKQEQWKQWRDNVVGQSGKCWMRGAKHRGRWREMTEGYIQQWMDTAS